MPLLVRELSGGASPYDYWAIETPRARKNPAGVWFCRLLASRSEQNQRSPFRSVPSAFPRPAVTRPSHQETPETQSSPHPKPHFQVAHCHATPCCEPPRGLPLPGASAVSCWRDELQTDDHMHTDGLGGKNVGQEGGTSPVGGPDGHWTLARVTTCVETCHPPLQSDISSYSRRNCKRIECFAVLQEPSGSDSGRGNPATEHR